MNMKKISIILTSIISLVFIIALTFLLVINFNLEFKLIGNKSGDIDVISNYTEEGYKAKIFNKDITNKVIVKSNLDINRVGTYKIEYKINVFGITHKLVRTINVVDDEAPVITLNGKDTVYIYKGDEYIDNGANAIDNYDGNLTSKISVESSIDTKTVGEYIVVYSVSDSSGNKSSIERKVIVTKSKSKVENINNPMVDYIVKNNYNISFGYYNLVSGKSYLYNEDKVYFAASLIKIVEALYLYDNDMVDDNIKSYVKKTITVSDNPAHHYLQSIIGKDNLKKYGESLGAKYTLAGGGVCGNTTVNDQLVFLKRLYEITKGDNEELKSWFINDYANSLNFDKNIKVMHKYGLYDNVYHDVGIVLDEEPYIVMILTGIPSSYTSVVNKLSKIIYDYHLSI